MISVRTRLHVGAALLLAATAVMTAFGVAYGQPAKPAVTTKVVKAPAKLAVVTKVVKAPASAPLAHAALLAPTKAPASQPVVVAVVAKPAPASQPTIKVPAGFMPWLQTNASWFIPLLIFVLSSLATVLSKYPRAKGLVAALRMFLGGVSALEFKDGKRPGLVLKWPATLPAPPPSDPEPPQA